jgi:hypothetical protein
MNRPTLASLIHIVYMGQWQILWKQRNRKLHGVKNVHEDNKEHAH